MKSAFALLFSLYTIFSYAQHDIIVYYEYTPDGYALYADSKETFPVIIEFEFDLLNLKVVREGPSAIVVPSEGRKIKLVDLVAINKFKGYKFKYTYITRENTRQVVTLDPVTSLEIAVKSDSVAKTGQPPIAAVEAPTPKAKKELRRSKLDKRKAAADTEIAVTTKTETGLDKVVKPEMIPRPKPPLKPVTSALPVVTPTSVIVRKTESKSPNEVDSKPLAASKSERRVEPVTSVIPEVKTVPKEMAKPVIISETIKQAVISTPPAPIVKYSVSGKHAAAFKYYLPFKKGGYYLVSQGYLGTVSHQNKYALDFEMSVGTEIYAARGGIVSEIIQHNSQRCASRDCEKYENYILINHSDGSFARYAHIRENGAVVKPGESINIGQHIGYSGDVGWTSEASLHFEVFLPVNDKEKSVKTNFLLGDGSDYGILLQQQRYLRAY